jgi:hypothetical protein
MRFRLLALLALCGCSSIQAPDSPQQRALSSCFFPVDRKGWSFLETPPQNAMVLKALVSGQRPPRGVSLDDGYDQLWFKHADGRLLVCSLYSFGNLPAVCSNTKYEFIYGTNGWVTQWSAPEMCIERN